jgi:peptidoglycan-associated lipoprotein
VKKNRLVLIVALIAAVTFLASCASHKPVAANAATQQAALEGYDVPLAEMTEGMTFTEPSPEDALILKNVHFDFNQSIIRADAKPILQGISTWMSNKPQAELMIEGHCDERGTREYNLALGEKRSLSIRTYLVGLGVNPARLHTISYGKEKPLCLESNERCWQINRCGQFRVSYGANRASAVEKPLPPAEVRRQIDREVVTEEKVAPAQEETPHGRSIRRYYD